MLRVAKMLHVAVLTDQVMYFDDYHRHSFNMLNLTSSSSPHFHPRPLTLPHVGSLTPFAISVDANFIYLSNEHPRSVEIACVTMATQ